MIAPDILAQVRRIEILTGKLVSETFAGEYLSVFKGRGMEFAEVREYAPGDDIRAIDWNVTARTGRLHIRRYTEERELTVIIACDLSGSQFFASAGSLKKEIAAEISALLAFSALRNNDKVGLFLFTDDIEEYVPPKKGRRHVLHLIRDVLAYAPKNRGTRISAALDAVNRVLKRRTILFLISDFRNQGFEKSLKLSSLKHDVIPIIISDPREITLPKLGAFLHVADPESGRKFILDASNPSVLAAYHDAEESRLKNLENLFNHNGLDHIRVSTELSYIDPIIRFFKNRANRLRR
ncbi:MAG: DUF58 domain-containing protein [Elusimicrobiota bacterium]